MWVDPDSGITVWTVKHFGHRPYLLNQERKDDRHKRAKVVAYWRETFALEAMVSDLPRPLPGPVHICVHVDLMHGWKQDVGACFPTAKAAIDGLVDAGFLPDDGPEWVKSLSFTAPDIHQPENGITLHVCLATPGLEG